MKRNSIGESYICGKEWVKGFLEYYSYVEGGFEHNTLMHVEKALSLVLVKSDALPCWL